MKRTFISLFEIDRRHGQRSAADEADLDAAIVVAPEARADTKHFVATCQVAQDGDHLVIALAGFQARIVFHADLAAGDRKESEKSNQEQA